LISGFARRLWGITLYDSSSAYGAGHAEVLLGRGLGSMRGEVVFATK
jgi:aryl-alcohol dehydrogenase-like predicted oxidoreductase